MAHMHFISSRPSGLLLCVCGSNHIAKIISGLIISLYNRLPLTHAYVYVQPHYIFINFLIVAMF